MRWYFDPFSHVRRPPFGHRKKKDSSCLHYYHDLSICLGRAWQLGKTERKPTADNDSFQPKRHCFHPVRDFLHQPSLLNVSSEKGDHSTRGCYGDGEPDDAPERSAETVLLPHGDQCEKRHRLGPGIGSASGSKL